MISRQVIDLDLSIIEPSFHHRLVAVEMSRRRLAEGVPKFTCYVVVGQRE